MKKMAAQWIAGLLTLSAALADQPVQLIKTWASEPVLDVPECALFNPADNLLYVSNVAGGPFEKNGKGFIAKVDLSGQIVEMKWATGLNAPKGMALFGDHLYVSDIDRLVKIDLNSGQTVQSYPAEGAASLNDVAVDAEGIVYVSDSRATQTVLHRLIKDALVPWFPLSELGTINGLHMDGDRLLAGQAKDGTLYAIDTSTGQQTVLGKIDTGIDGLKPDGRGSFFTSNWKGRITRIDPTGEGTTLLDTTADNINQADFEYLPEQNLLIIPTFFDNRLVAYKAVPRGLAVGDRAPNFEAMDSNGKPWALQDHLGNRPIVVYFYPAAMTGGCTKQACSYRDYIGQNKEPAFHVIGISADTPQNLAWFRQAETLNFPLLSDPAGKIARAFGVTVKDGERSIQRTIDGNEVELTRSATAMRWTFIIDPDGTIIYRDNQVNAQTDLENVVRFLKDTSAK